MKQYVGDKSVAWFKLAECIGRGEKERALGLCRLLTYSFHDQAFIKKLEAEIIAVFDKQLAAKAFVAAAHLYFARGDIKETFFIYQTLHSIFPQNSAYIERLIDLSPTHAEAAAYQQALSLLVLPESTYIKNNGTVSSYQ